MSVLCFTINTTKRNERCIIWKQTTLNSSKDLDFCWLHLFDVRNIIIKWHTLSTQSGLPIQERQGIIENEQDHTREHNTPSFMQWKHIPYSRSCSEKFSFTPERGPATNCQMLLFTISLCETWWHMKGGTSGILKVENSLPICWLH